jgi:hypothetical protein
MDQTLIEKDIGVVIGREPNKRRALNYFCDTERDCFIWLTNKMMVTRHISRKGLVMIELPEMVVFSLYAGT